MTGSRRREGWIVAGVCLLAVALRVVHVLSMRASPYFDEPVMDPLYHVEWARALAAGRDFQPGPFFRAPLYPWFLAGLFKLFGDGLLLPRLVQALFGTLSTALVYSIGRRAFDARVGLVAALLVATNWVLIYYDGELKLETLAVPLYLLGLRLSMELSADPRPRRALATGLVFGVSALVRPNILLLMPVLALWLLWIARPRGRAALWPAAALTLGVLLPILPISAYNTFVGGDRVLISTQGGVNFWIGNNPDSDGSTAIVPGTRGGWWEGYHDAIAQAEALEGRALAPSEVSRHYSRRAWRWILGSPREALAHLAWKARLYGCDAELGNNLDATFFARRFSPLVRFLPPSFALLAPLGLVGMLLALRGGAGPRLPLLAYVLVYSASVVAFFVCARFRMPVLPALAVFAGHALVTALELARRRRLGPLALFVAAVLALAAGVRAVPARIDTSQASGHWLLGAYEMDRGRWAEALPLLERAVQENPRLWHLRRDLGRTLVALGRPAEAVPHLEAALGLWHPDVEVLAALADAYLQAGRTEEALGAARRASSLRPDLAAGPYEEGRVHARRGALAEVRRAWRRAVQAEPEHFFANLGLGLVELEAGEAREAARSLSSAVRSPQAAPPWLLQAYEGLVRARLALGERAAAAEALEEARRRLPHEPGLAALERLLGG